MALLAIHPAERDTFADGLDEAGRIVASFSMRDPLLLRAAASSLEARATTSYELGVATGLRIVAAEELDRIADGFGMPEEVRP